MNDLDLDVKITSQCISLEKQMVQLRDAIAHGDWEKAKDILDRIGEIAGKEDPIWKAWSAAFSGTKSSWVTEEEK